MNSLAKAVELKKELDALRPIKKEDELRIMQKFRLDWNYHSNHIEGNSLTYGETKALIMFGITAQGKPLKDHFEVTGHDEAVKWVTEIIKDERPLTENFIRELHKLILKEPYEVDAITPEGQPTKRKIAIGVYKTAPNHVQTKTGEVFRFATPEETPAKMSDLMSWYRDKSEEEEVNPLLLAAEFHYRYIRIHPFDDGNDRTVRILMNFILMRFGYPPVIIKTEDKKNYLAALQQADAGMIEKFVEYIAQNLVQSLELMIKGAQGQSIEEPDDLEKEIALLEQKLNSAGQSIETTRSKDRVLEIYDKSVIPLAEKFLEKGRLFERFYISTQGQLRGEKDSIELEKKALLSDKLTIVDYAFSIDLMYEYNGLKQFGHEKFRFLSAITFRFEIGSYFIKDYDHETKFEKLYNQQLTEEEITQLVNAEVKRHKDAIEEKIREINGDSHS